MKIIIDPHTVERAIERGASEIEIINTLENGTIIIGKKGRLGKAMVFEFNNDWKGEHYDQKKLEVFYLIENDVIITVTVYVYYGKWES